MTLLKGFFATLVLAAGAGFFILALTGSVPLMCLVCGLTGVYFGVWSACLARRERNGKTQ